METLSIVEANPYFLPHLGGIENRMHVTSKHFAERGHDVTVLTAQLPGTPVEEETEYGYRIVRVSSKFYNIYNPPYVTSRGVLDALNRISPDIVNYNYRWAFSFDGEVSRYTGKKVFTYHNMWGEGVGYQRYISEANDALYRKKLDRYDHIVAVTDYVRDDLIRRGIDPSRVTAVDNCLDVVPDITRTEGDFILSLGRLVATKGLDCLIEAMRDVDYRLIICGTGPEEKTIRRLVSKYGLEDRVEIRGWVSEEEKNRLMDTCRFFVMPSIYESYGLAALEVMSYGKPIVCTDVDGLPGNVKDAGLYVKPKDPRGLAEGINRLLSDNACRAELSENALKVSRAVTWDQQILKLENQKQLEVICYISSVYYDQVAAGKTPVSSSARHRGRCRSRPGSPWTEAMMEKSMPTTTRGWRSRG